MDKFALKAHFRGDLYVAAKHGALVLFSLLPSGTRIGHQVEIPTLSFPALAKFLAGFAAAISGRAISVRPRKIERDLYLCYEKGNGHFCISFQDESRASKFEITNEKTALAAQRDLSFFCRIAAELIPLSVSPSLSEATFMHIAAEWLQGVKGELLHAHFQAACATPKHFRQTLVRLKRRDIGTGINARDISRMLSWVRLNKELLFAIRTLRKLLPEPEEFPDDEEDDDDDDGGGRESADGFVTANEEEVADDEVLAVEAVAAEAASKRARRRPPPTASAATSSCTYLTSLACFVQFQLTCKLSPFRTCTTKPTARPTD